MNKNDKNRLGLAMQNEARQINATTLEATARDHCRPKESKVSPPKISNP